MVKRTASSSDQEPDEATFEKPSEGEHLFQVVDVYDATYEANMFNLDPDTVMVKCEVVGGKEEGRSLLNRLNLDDQWKGFFATRLFLKSIGEQYKGDFSIDTDNWIGRQFYASVVHNESKGKIYANIAEYNFEKNAELKGGLVGSTPDPEKQWDV